MSIIVADLILAFSSSVFTPTPNLCTKTSFTCPYLSFLTWVSRAMFLMTQQGAPQRSDQPNKFDKVKIRFHFFPPKRTTRVDSSRVTCFCFSIKNSIILKLRRKKMGQLLKVCPGHGTSLGSSWFSFILSIYSSALDHSATASP